jgi:hypothetical protein
MITLEIERTGHHEQCIGQIRARHLFFNSLRALEN